MSDELAQPFESIESAQEFVELLAQAIEESKAEIEVQAKAAQDAGEERQQQALQLVAYKLASLGSHMATSRRILNDLRTLRRLLLEERRQARKTADL
jgi:phospholipid N-methyltransferase